MYRIQKAVIKAKDSSPGINRPGVEANNSPLENLTYSKTKVVPTHPDTLEDSRIVAGFSNDPRSQVFKTLRTQVIKKMRENQWKTLAITSPSVGEGKSIIAANLAVAIAREVNQTVLLVDMDLKNPILSEYFNFEPDYGLLDYLSGEAELADIMVNPGIERLVMVPGKGTVDSSSELISSPSMVSFFHETKTRYKSRIVIYDMPPILPTDDVLSSIGNIDAALLVLEDGRNPEKDIERALQQLQGTGLVGTVLNKFHKGAWII